MLLERNKKMNKIDIRIPIIIVLVIILSVMVFIYFKSDSSNNQNIDYSQLINSSEVDETDSDNKIVLSTTSQVSSALTENLELHATYKFSKLLVKKNQLIKKGTKIIKYTNGKYLKAPYDCIITDYNLPSKKGLVTNEHYITISSNNVLQVKLSVDESKISSIEIGKSAKVKISAIEEEIEGIVTKISNTASKGKFTVTVEFNNNSNVMIGMTASVTIYKDLENIQIFIFYNNNFLILYRY